MRLSKSLCKRGRVAALSFLLILVLALPAAGQIVTPSAPVEVTRAERALSDVGNLASVALEQVASAPLFDGAAVDVGADLDQLYTLEHNVPVGSGRSMRVQESFTPYSWTRWPRRGILMISSSAFNRHAFSIPVDGYNATAELARLGMFVYTLDYLGIGESYRPEDGRDVTREDTIEAMKRVIQYFRGVRQIPKLDIFAEGYGSTLAPYLAADASSIRRLVMSATIYKHLNDGPLTTPAFIDMLRHDEDGYIFVPPETYDSVMPDAPPGVLHHQRTTQSGSYPIAFLPTGVQFPFFDPGVARAPGLIIYGREDTFAGPGDPEALAADYGTHGADLVFLDDAGHAPRVEDPETAARFWAEVLRFIEP